jgi:HEAT repeat protein
MPGISRQNYSLLERILLALLLCTTGCYGRTLTGTAEISGHGEGNQVTIQDLAQQIQQLNGEARDTARKLGPGALAKLLQLYPSAPARGRALILECLDVVKGEEAVEALLRALQDPEADVRNTAIDLLHTTNGPSAIEPLTSMALYSPHPRVRGEAARILGRMGAVSAVPHLRKHLSGETDPEAARKVALSIARLDDGPERIPFLDKLTDPSPKLRYQAVADVEFINDPRLIPRLVPLLKDEEPVINLGQEMWPLWHRVCDRTVDAIAALSRKPFPFPIGKRNYLRTEIEQANQIAKPFGK